MTNQQMAEAVHIYYNYQTNLMESVQYRKDLEMYEVQTWHENGRLSLSIMSMERILDERKGKQNVWHHLGVL